MKFIKFLLSVRKGINVLVLVAISIVVVLEAGILQLPNDSDGTTREIIVRICLSILSSYIFYLIVVHWKAESDKTTIATYVNRKLDRIVGRCKGQLNHFGKLQEISGDDLWRNPEDVDAIFQTVDPNGNSPIKLGIQGPNANYMQYLDSNRRDTNDAISKVFRKMPFLSSELVVLLTELEDCVHFSSISFCVQNPIKNTDLSAWAPAFIDYVQICKRIEKYRLDNV